MGPYHKARDTLTAAKDPKTKRMSLDGNLTKDVTVAGEMDLQIVKLEKVEESFDVEYETGQHFDNVVLDMDTEMINRETLEDEAEGPFDQEDVIVSFNEDDEQSKANELIKIETFEKEEELTQEDVCDSTSEDEESSNVNEVIKIETFENEEAFKQEPKPV